MIISLILLNLLASTSFAEIGYQTGHISMNDSEITILINSTFEIIEDFDNDTEPIPTQTITEAPVTTTTTEPKRIPKIRFQKIRPILTQCQTYNESQKYRMLEDAGGRNQRYMANSVDEASKNFADYYPDTPFTTPNQDHVEAVVAVGNTSAAAEDPSCDDRCQMIKLALNQEIERRQTSITRRSVNSKIRATILNDSTLNGCLLGNFIPVGTCTDLGEELPDGTESLCSECLGLFMLSSNCFPQIFNAVQCNSQETGCIFDTFTDKAHGQCGVQTLSFKVLRNTGDENCEDWAVEQIQIPVACQCSLSKSSFLRATPNKEL